MPKRKNRNKARIQLNLDVDIARSLKMEAARNLQTLTKFITTWVESWKKKKK